MKNNFSKIQLGYVIIMATIKHERTNEAYNDDDETRSVTCLFLSECICKV